MMTSDLQQIRGCHSLTHTHAQTYMWRMILPMTCLIVALKCSAGGGSGSEVIRGPSLRMTSEKTTLRRGVAFWGW